MFKNHVLRFIDYKNQNKLIIRDEEDINRKAHYLDSLSAYGFKVVYYTDDLSFRIDYEDDFKDDTKRMAIIDTNDSYIPFDILSKARCVHLSIDILFSRLNSLAIKESEIDYDLLAFVYDNSYISNCDYLETKSFINNVVLSKEMISKYIKLLSNQIQGNACSDNYKYWFDLARLKARIKKYTLKYGLSIPQDSADERFKEYLLKDYGKLSSIVVEDTPILVSKAMDFIIERSKKYALIVMDGMSVFDWDILSSTFSNLNYSETNAFAMIPTVTSISRQCLLSNKYPVQLINPWSQSKEKQEFVEYARSAGYSDYQISYQRGYDVELNPNIECLAIIINDIDDIVHGQQQGLEGMYNDISLMAKQEKLAELSRKLLKTGFDVYISADHGNTSSIGIGNFKTGVEMETKSKRMLVLKNIADKESLLNKYPLIEYPKYYLDKQYDYLICDNGISFDNRGEEVMTHGGISIEEVIVPFIMLKSEDNNG